MAIAITSATYTGLGAICSVAVAASAHMSHVSACHGRSGVVCTLFMASIEWRPTAVTCSPDAACGSLDFVKAVIEGAGEVGARPTLTRNCERRYGPGPYSVSQATHRRPPDHRRSELESNSGSPGL